MNTDQHREDGLVIGIDIGGTNTAFGIMDISGKILFESTIATQAFEKVDAFAHAIREKLTECCNEELLCLKGIGIGAPNGNYYNGTIEYAPNLQWKGIVKLQEIFNRHFDLPVFITNDANAAAIGEMTFGAAKNMKDFIMITLGTGVGSGIVVNGSVVYGHDGFAGEAGHTIVIPHGRLCGCGRHGCLESYLSAAGVKQTVQDLLNQSDVPSILRNIPAEDLTTKIVYDAALKNDKIALDAFEYSGRILGMQFADMVAFTSPEAIFLFGGLAKAGDFLLTPAKRHMEEHLLQIYQQKVKILPSALMNSNAAILGAGALAWKELSKLGQPA